MEPQHSQLVAASRDQYLQIAQKENLNAPF